MDLENLKYFPEDIRLQAELFLISLGKPDVPKEGLRGLSEGRIVEVEPSIILIAGKVLEGLSVKFLIDGEFIYERKISKTSLYNRTLTENCLGCSLFISWVPFVTRTGELRTYANIMGPMQILWEGH